MKRSRAAILLAPALLGGCLSVTPPVPNPNGLPAEALTLEYVFDHGCLPYVLGGKTEEQAMHGVRLHYFRPIELPIGFDPPAGPVWKGAYPGLFAVGVGRSSCTITMRGGHLADYRAVVRRVLDQRLGPADRPDFADFAPLPERLTGCRLGVHYAYYEERRPLASSFHLELNRADCSPLLPPSNR